MQVLLTCRLSATSDAWMSCVMFVMIKCALHIPYGGPMSLQHPARGLHNAKNMHVGSMWERNEMRGCRGRNLHTAQVWLMKQLGIFSTLMLLFWLWIKMAGMKCAWANTIQWQPRSFYSMCRESVYPPLFKDEKHVYHMCLPIWSIETSSGQKHPSPKRLFISFRWWLSTNQDSGGNV